MPLSEEPAGSPQEWLRYARGDLALARTPVPPGGLRELLCFHAQQAAEKSIKAVLLLRGVEFPWTHVLERLVELLPADIPRTAELLECACLSVYATTARYPGRAEEVREEEHLEAVKLAERVLAWAGEEIQRAHGKSETE